MRRKDKNQKWALAFVIVNMVLFTIFFAWPGILGVYYSFTDYTGISASFIGLDNYIQLFQDKSFYKSLGRTILYTAVGVPLLYAFSLLISVLLVSKFTKGKSVAKVIFFFPWLISSIVTGVIFRWLFGESFGFVNFVLSLIGMEPVGWSSDGNMAFILVLFATVWMGTAFNMLLMISALVNIPQSYYEAADIDGASGWQKFIHVTLPSLKPTSFMVILLSVIHLMKEFPMVQALNNGGPGTDNTFLVQYIYQTGFDQRNIGYASAVSMVLFVILLLFAIINLKVEERSKL
ncbi:sugar ABC transporter permease [Rossellomorea marisflavi]|uniref:carbohydrate ABC transporter permease n=1 Tax=Rossellomorea TaxID=2837508 RepID=UPI000A707F9E|nr:sugar ABC transporter permease [Rossellomorea marisflavi]MCM2605916.1 sugar ABC transporter permease [Rossellomorea marisflavi]USK92434.1 sugar ABC transporter permease [Rossellomorea marisflavi]